VKRWQGGPMINDHFPTQPNVRTSGFLVRMKSGSASAVPTVAAECTR